MTQRPIKFFAEDVGNSATKYAYFVPGGIKYGIIPNVVGDRIKLDTPPSGRLEDMLSVQVLSADQPEFREPKFIGKLAQVQCQDLAFQNLDRDKANAEGVNIIAPAVLAMECSQEEDVVLGFSATLTDYAEQAPRLRQKLTKRHSVEFEYGNRWGGNPWTERPVSVNVIDVEVYPQCAAGLYGLTKNDNGTVVRGDWNNKTVLGLDFGHGQVNVAILQDLMPVKRACFSLDYGFSRVVGAVQNYLNSKHYVTASIPQLQRAVEQGFYEVRGKKIDLTEVIDEACAQTMDLIYPEIANNYQRIPKMLFDSISEVVVMGGAAKTFAPYVGSRFDVRPEIANLSIYANVRGLLLRAAARRQGKEG